MLQRSVERARARRSDEGFTLIELLIVIVILGILAAIVVFSVSGITDKGAKSACQAEVSTVDTAIEAFYAQSASGGGSPAYPTTVAQLVPGFLHSTPKYVNSVTSGTSGHGAGVVAGAPCTGDA
ncbi:MAG: hypothetical protein NVSMB48_19280 [Marmoricola sp.]